MVGVTGSGVYGWGTEEEEDLWTVSVVAVNPERQGTEADEESDDEDDITVGELAQWRYMCSEQEKERVPLCSLFAQLIWMLTQDEGKPCVQERRIWACHQIL